MVVNRKVGDIVRVISKSKGSSWERAVHSVREKTGEDILDVMMRIHMVIEHSNIYGIELEDGSMTLGDFLEKDVVDAIKEIKSEEF